MGCQKESVKVFRELLSILRTVLTTSQEQVVAYKQSYGYRYVTLLCENKRNIGNEDKTKELHYIGKTYICLLESVNDFKVLYQRYKGSGEQNVHIIAERVGFKLPNVSK